MTSNILNLRRLNVDQIEEKQHLFLIHASAAVDPSHCPHCNGTHFVRFGRREQMIKDLPIHGKQVCIYFDTRRFLCRECKKTFLEQFPDFHADRNMTTRLVTWIGKQSVSRTYASLAEETGVVEGTIRNIFHDYVQDLERSMHFETPKILGINPIHLIKQRTVITNIEKNTIIDILPDRSHADIVAFLSRLPVQAGIEYVSMDMSAPCKTAVEEALPQAIIAIDKSHVVRMANVALEQVRMDMRKQLPMAKKRGLVQDRSILMKRSHELTESDVLVLNAWATNFPAIGEAYRLKESFHDIFDAKSKEEADAAYKGWLKKIPRDMSGYYEVMVEGFKNWKPYILNYFSHPVAKEHADAHAEALDSLYQVLGNLGRGYSFEAIRAKLVFSQGTHVTGIADGNMEQNYGSDMTKLAQLIAAGKN